VWEEVQSRQQSACRVVCSSAQRHRQAGVGRQVEARGCKAGSSVQDRGLLPLSAQASSDDRDRSSHRAHEQRHYAPAARQRRRFARPYDVEAQQCALAAPLILSCRSGRQERLPSIYALLLYCSLLRQCCRKAFSHGSTREGTGR